MAAAKSLAILNIWRLHQQIVAFQQRRSRLMPASGDQQASAERSDNAYAEIARHGGCGGKGDDVCV